MTLVLLLAAAPLAAQTIPRNELTTALRTGGLVIVMRHANSPRQAPDAASADPENTGRERQLDEEGRRDAMAMGAALKRLGVPVNEVLSSPTYRALQTAKLLDAGRPRAVEELSNEGMAATRDSRVAWLRAQVAAETKPGGNRLLVTHGPNLSGAFPEYTAGMAEGEALIFDPRGKDGPLMIQRMKIGEWLGL